MSQITIYSTPTCYYCKLAKEFFTKHGMAYTEYDVKADEQKRDEMIEKSGQRGVPVILIDQMMITGFNEKDVKAFLKIK